MKKIIALALASTALVAVPTAADAHGRYYGGYSYGYGYPGYSYGYRTYGYSYAYPGYGYGYAYSGADSFG